MRLRLALIALLANLSPASAQGINNPCTSVATSTLQGCVKPDGTTITNTAGAISVTYGTAAASAAQGNDSRILAAAAQTGPTAWTPIDGSAAGLAFTNVSANYTRIGNMVFAYGTLRYPSTASGANALISNLPVTVANQGYAATACSISSNGTSLASAQVGQNATTINLYTTSLVEVTNLQMSLAFINFICIYPAT